MRFSEDWFQAQRLPEFGNGPVYVALAPQGISEIAVRFRKVWLQVYGFAVFEDRSVQVSLNLEQFS